MKDQHNYFETNRNTWNQKVNIHAKSDMYALEAFKAGGVGREGGFDALRFFTEAKNICLQY